MEIKNEKGELPRENKFMLGIFYVARFSMTVHVIELCKMNLR